MAFFAIHIAPCPGFGFTGGPEFSTDIKNLQSGREKRNGEWAICRHKYSVPFNNIPNDAYLSIKEVFLICRGKLHTFLHRDWADFQAYNEQFAVADGVKTVFQLSKRSALGGGEYDRVITKPVAGAVITVNGVEDPTAVVSSSTGSVTFLSPPADDAVLRWSGQFDVQVRFDIDYLPFSLDNANNTDGYITNGSVDLVEVLDE